ncbi:hypothetical protein [Dongia sedimenti]|uniref:Uncharacterized protein n=1 Tax=Dongia sedimenti TaxID=3064282 RepID=A0ABU0YWF7_9PROT|nr:hypothetical protein [Rhodospirillaceae bacterium R-7]
MFKPRSKDEILQQRFFIGFQDAFVGPPQSSRKFVNLDSVAVNDFDKLDELSYKDLHSFVVEYRGRSEVFTPENEWYRFELASVTSRSNARIIPLLPDGYGEPLAVYLSGAERLPPLQSASAKGNPHRQPSQRFDLGGITRGMRLSSLSGHGRLALAQQENIQPIKTTVVVHDVGQASCVSILQRPPSGELTAYLKVTLNGRSYVDFEKVMLDCGLPLYFNWERDRRRKYGIAAQPVDGTLIVLSHWDMDHYELGRRNLDRSNMWLAPTQVVGPTSWRIANHLSEQERIAFVEPNFELHLDTISLWRGPVSAKLNDSGILVAVAGASVGDNGRMETRRFLYPADCPLSCMDLAQAPALGSGEEIHLVVSHHGSEPWNHRLTGHPGNAVISSGWRNYYKHPDPQAVRTYQAARFTVSDTRLMQKDISIEL